MPLTRLTPERIAQKWATNLGASTNNIRDAVAAIDFNPMERAAARAAEYVQGVQRAVAEERWQRGLRNVTAEQWKAAMITKGLPRIGTGAAAAQGKFAVFMRNWMNFQASLQTRLAQTPRGNLQQNIARAVLVITESAAQRGKMKPALGG